MSQRDWIEALERSCAEDDSKKLAEAVETSAFRDLQQEPYQNEKNLWGWPSSGSYLLCFAGIRGAVACVEVLLRVVDVDARTKIQRTVLHHAAIGDRSEIARLLISAGSNVNAKDIYGRSPIHLAAGLGKVQTLLVLCGETGADVNVQDYIGATPLYDAVYYHETESVRVLLDFGASADISGLRNETPREMAVRRKFQDIVDLIVKAGARTAEEVTAYYAASQAQSDSTALDCPSSSAGSEEAVRYRSALAKHIPLVSRCKELDAIDCARRLRSKGHVTTPVINVLENVQSSQGDAEARSSLATLAVGLPDSAICCLVEETLAEMGLGQLVSTIRLCPGQDACKLESTQCHVASDDIAEPKQALELGMPVEDIESAQLQTMLPNTKRVDHRTADDAVQVGVSAEMSLPPILQKMKDDLSPPVEAVPIAIDSDLVFCPPGNTDLAETLVIQNFSRTFSGPQGHYFRLEKAVTMGTSDGLISQPVEVNLKTNRIAASENVFLVHVEKESSSSSLWKVEHGIDETQDATGDMFVLEPPERQRLELSFSITDEDGNCTHFPGDQPGALRDPYTRFVVDRKNDRVTYSKTSFCKDILLVTNKNAHDKIRIANFIRSVQEEYSACRYLVYARPYLQHGVMLMVDLQESGVFDAPVRFKSEPGDEQVGFTRNWLLLSLNRHSISGHLILDPEMEALWSHKFELVKDEASTGLTVKVTPRGSIETAPGKLIGELEVYGISRSQEAKDGICAANEHRLSARVDYDAASRKSLMPTKVNPPIASSVKMSDEHRCVLRRAHCDLAQNLQLEDTLLDFLLSESVLPPSLYSTLTEETDRSKKVRPFLGQLQSLGPNAFHKFVAGLEKTGVDANVTLAKQLRRLEKEPANV